VGGRRGAGLHLVRAWACGVQRAYFVPPFLLTSFLSFLPSPLPPSILLSRPQGMDPPLSSLHRRRHQGDAQGALWPGKCTVCDGL